ncbi:MAG: hypothetical protein FJ220_03625 [Kiritimatiellaceae bacterium]|nr:hypothetical protein [Kiritimatiellaceae bacterium]
MNRKIIICLLVLIGLTACNQKHEETQKIDAQIQHYMEFINAKKGPAPQLDQIKVLYDQFSDLLVQADLKSQADLYLAQAATNANMSPFLQGVDKTVQQALVKLMRNELYQLTSKFGRADHVRVDNAYALYGGLSSVAERRGKYIGSDTLFTSRIEGSFEHLREGVEIPQAVHMIDQTINDIYFLSVLYEIEGITENRGVNDVIVHEKQIEGLLFYSIIHDAAKDPAVSDKIRAEWGKNGYDINLDEMTEDLRVAFPELSARYGIKM